MITDVILKTIAFFASAFISILQSVIPQYTLDTSPLADFIDFARTILTYIDVFVPASAVVGTVIMVVFAGFALIIIKAVTWGLRRLPTQS